MSARYLSPLCLISFISLTFIFWFIIFIMDHVLLYFLLMLNPSFSSSFSHVVLLLLFCFLLKSVYLSMSSAIEFPFSCLNLPVILIFVILSTSFISPSPLCSSGAYNSALPLLGKIPAFVLMSLAALSSSSFMMLAYIHYDNTYKIVKTLNVQDG